MISSDLNQLLKKIKRHHRSSLPRPKGCPSPLDPFLSICSLYPWLLPLPLLLPFLSSLHTIMRASHVEKGLFAARDRKCCASLIIGCTTTTILERLSFRHRSSRFLPGPAAGRETFLPPSCRYRRGIAETVNQRQGRVRGRGIGAACSSLPLSREHDTVVNWNAVASRIQVLFVSRCWYTRRIRMNLLLPEIGARIGTGKRFNEYLRNCSVPPTTSSCIFLSKKGEIESLKRLAFVASSIKVS